MTVFCSLLHIFSIIMGSWRKIFLNMIWIFLNQINFHLSILNLSVISANYKNLCNLPILKSPGLEFLIQDRILSVLQTCRFLYILTLPGYLQNIKCTGSLRLMNWHFRLTISKNCLSILSFCVTHFSVTKLYSHFHND